MKKSLLLSFFAIVCIGLFVYYRNSLTEVPAKHLNLAKQCDKGDMRRCSMLALALKRDGDKSKARAFYSMACDGSDAYGCYGLGTFYKSEGNPTEAKRLFQKSCSIDPNDGGVEACLELKELN